MTQILLIGSEHALLEGVAQSFATLGFTPVVAESLTEARELAAQHTPLVAVVSRTLAASGSGEVLGIPLAPGGALILYRAIGSELVTLSPRVQRAVVADLTLPLERNRLIAVVQHVDQRAVARGRRSIDDGHEEISPP